MQGQTKFKKFLNLKKVPTEIIACKRIFFFWLSLRTLHLKTYFLGGEKQRLEIHLRSQATEMMAVLIKYTFTLLPSKAASSYITAKGTEAKEILLIYIIETFT